MQTGNFRKTLSAGLLVIVSMTTAVGQKVSRADSPGAIPAETLLRILRAEDERRWDENVRVLLGARYPITRRRAALALGRIGDERAVPALVDVLKQDVDNDVRQMAAFAIGEIESPAGADALIAVLDDTRQPAAVRARAVEALGKIGAVLLSNSAASANQRALPRAEDQPLAKIRLAILDALKFEAGRRPIPATLQHLIRKVAGENLTWGEERIARRAAAEARPARVAAHYSQVHTEVAGGTARRTAGRPAVGRLSQELRSVHYRL